MVMLDHLTGTRGFWGPSYLTTLGNTGVMVFFVISGFLITTLLLQELDATDHISLQNFCARRVLRLFPALYVFVGALALAAALGWLVLLPNDLLCAAAYTINYHATHSWSVGHLWSLAVEEQFYILWPLALVLLGRRRAIWAALGVLLAAPVTRIAILYLLPDQAHYIGKIFPTVADALAAGCVLALLRDRLSASKRYAAFIASPGFLVVPVVLVVAHVVSSEHPRISFLLGQTVLNVAIVLCLDRCMRIHSGPVGRVLNSRPFVYVGVLSYSLYLWQQPFLNCHSDSLFATFPLNVLMVAVAALGSYYLVERPFLGLRKYFRMKPAKERESPVSG